MTQTREDEGLELLGNQQVSYPTDYAPEMLETFQNKHPENDYFVKFNCPEFTSLCPITGQPDFATIYVNYVPDEKYIEVWGEFTPRGGISIHPYANYGRPNTRWEEVAWTRLSTHE